MTLLDRKPSWPTLLVTSALLLAACAGQADIRQTGTPPINPSVDSVALAFNPGDGSLWKADRSGLSRLAASGQAWESISTPATQASGLTAVAINPGDTDELYVSGLGIGVLKSTDSGRSWSDVNNGLASNDATALAMHSFRFGTLYVWLKDMGIFRTEDGGTTWVRMPDPGPPDRAVRGLVHSNLPGSMNTGWLYASTLTDAYLSMDCF